jgi:two-component system, sensor histidine kinase ChiS
LAIDEITNNLIDNAIKYTQEGGKIALILKRNHDLVEMIISDTGIGISKEDKDNIFKPYYQISHEKKYNQGIGMGLYIVKKIIDQINCKIELESEPDVGTTFKIIFNGHKLAPGEIIQESSKFFKPTNIDMLQIKDSEYNNERKNILIIEDNLDMLLYLKENISINFNVFCAINGIDALEKLMNIPKPDLIISDVMMNMMDGYEFRDILLENNKYRSIPFIFLSVKSLNEEKIEGLKKGAIDFISKPFQMDELLAKINSIIKNNDFQKELQLNYIEKKIATVFRNEKIVKDEIIDIEMKSKENNITEREKEVLYHLIKGKENKEIAGDLKVSINTIKTHIQNIYSKFKVQNKVELLNIIYEKNKTLYK